MHQSLDLENNHSNFNIISVSQQECLHIAHQINDFITTKISGNLQQKCLGLWTDLSLNGKTQFVQSYDFNMEICEYWITYRIKCHLIYSEIQVESEMIPYGSKYSNLCSPKNGSHPNDKICPGWWV